MNDILTRLGHIGIIPVVAVDEAAQAVPLAEALLWAGLPCAEFTFRTAVAAEAIQAASQAFPQMLIGAGTVLTVAQAKQAVAAGAKYILSPGFDAGVVDYCLAQNIPVLPGVMTPTDITQAVAKGLKVLKFFPAEAAGGVAALKSISDPFVGIKFVPTGGISAQNLVDYLRLPMVHACGGSWLVKKTLINAGEFGMIAALAQAAVGMVQNLNRKS
ncbi:MAG: bifunctional 4-hydroxy-2-oxoglutarate aldolase/2-dehydro-3-deoxy-phosphogluconate aldolase [Ardenticatenaceae bacterium]|nr:bifunctional 4-hydroxy-2-oxoglutarate aldolase/2-dehydro-3-deoxy-phosphogluconate aldolase [Ardenticatenaceae bacterium]